MTYKSIRIANEILEYAEIRQIEKLFIVEMGDIWLNGKFTDQMQEEFPQIKEAMNHFEYRYSPSELSQAFELLLECEA